MEHGKKKNEARAEAARKFQKEERSYALDLAGESRLIQGQAEEAFKELESMVSSENWDPAMTMGVLSQAKRFDETYGSHWRGGSAQSYFAKKLHLGPTNKEVASQYRGSGAGGREVQGPNQGPVKSPLAGFISLDQKHKVEQSARDARTENIMSTIQLDALQTAMRGADGPGGVPDPDVIAFNLTKHQAEIAAKYDLDPRDLLLIYADLRAQLADQFAPIVLSEAEQIAREKLIDSRSEAGTKYIDGLYSEKDSLSGMMTILEGTSEIRKQMQEFWDKQARAGDDIAQIKLELGQVFGTADGGWPGSPIKDPYLARMPKDKRVFSNFSQKSREFYQQPGVEEDKWVPEWSEQDRVGAMVNTETGQIVPLIVPQQPVIDEVPPPSLAPPFSPPPASAPTPGEQSKAAGTSPDTPISEKEYRDKNGNPLTGDALVRAQAKDRAEAKLSAISKDLGVLFSKNTAGSVPAYPGSIQPPGPTEKKLLADARKLRSDK